MQNQRMCIDCKYDDVKYAINCIICDANLCPTCVYHKDLIICSACEIMQNSLVKLHLEKSTVSNVIAQPPKEKTRQQEKSSLSQSVVRKVEESPDEIKLCACGHLIKVITYGVVRNTRCAICNEMTCKGCKRFCIHHGVRCNSCGSNGGKDEFQNCESCGDSLCLPCRNSTCDLMEDALVCENHKLVCHYSNFGPFERQELFGMKCKGSFYRIPRYICQINNCSNYACSETMDIIRNIAFQAEKSKLQINPIKYVCHGHLFKCDGCKTDVIMFKYGVVKGDHGKVYHYCPVCYNQIKSLIDGFMMAARRRNRPKYTIKVMILVMIPYIHSALYYI